MVGEDVDLLVLLAASTPNLNKNYSLKPGSDKIEKHLCSTKCLRTVDAIIILFYYFITHILGTIHRQHYFKKEKEMHGNIRKTQGRGSIIPVFNNRFPTLDQCAKTGVKCFFFYQFIEHLIEKKR